MNTIIKLTAVVICGLILAACGGGGDDGDGGTSPGGGNTGDQSAYTATPSVSGSGGAISPATPVSVQSGATASFTLTPNSGYTASVTGTCGGTLNGNTYTTHAASANCTVVAAFTAASSALTFSYDQQYLPSDMIDRANFLTQTSPEGFLAMMNQEGAQGYFYYDEGGSCPSLAVASRTIT